LNFLLFATIIFGIVMNRELNNLDEVWIFNMARNIANGLLPYKDFNLVVTPGLPILCGLILKLFGTEMFIMRILAVIIDAVIIFMIYKIFKLFNINKYAASLISILIAILFIDSFCIDYNFMVLMIALITLYFELRNYYKCKDIFEHNVKTELLLGVFIGISIAMKQTTGLCLSIVFIGYKLLAVRNKNDLKKLFRVAITRLVGVIIPVIILVIYLISNNIMTDFIDYTILGISDFSNNKPYINLLNGELWLLALLVPIIIIGSLVVYMKKKDSVLMILFAYSIATIVVVYPIADTIHFLIGGTITIITGIYIMLKCFEIKIEHKISDKVIIWSRNFLKAFTKILMICIAVMYIYKSAFWVKECNKYDTLKNFKYIPVSEGLEELILEVGQYIKNSKEDVYIVDASAAVYMIPLNRYNKNYDMFMTGNFGAKGSQGIIDDLKTKKNTKWIILNDEAAMNWQTPRNVIRYIKDTYMKVGEIKHFDIYK